MFTSNTMRCHISECEMSKCPFSTPLTPLSSSHHHPQQASQKQHCQGLRAVNKGKRDSIKKLSPFHPLQSERLECQAWKNRDAREKGGLEKVDSAWIPFGIMIAVKTKARGKEKLVGRGGGGGDVEGQRRRDRQAEGERERETPAVASPAVIIVLTFKWKALTMGAG